MAKYLVFTFLLLGSAFAKVQYSIDTINKIQTNLNQLSEQKVLEAVQQYKAKTEYLNRRFQQLVINDINLDQYDAAAADCQIETSGFWNDCKQCISKQCTSYFSTVCDNGQQISERPNGETAMRLIIERTLPVTTPSIPRMTDLIKESASRGDDWSLIYTDEDGTKLTFKTINEINSHSQVLNDLLQTDDEVQNKFRQKRSTSCEVVDHREEGDITISCDKDITSGLLKVIVSNDGPQNLRSNTGFSDKVDAAEVSPQVQAAVSANSANHPIELKVNGNELVLTLTIDDFAGVQSQMNLSPQLMRLSDEDYQSLEGLGEIEMVQDGNNMNNGPRIGGHESNSIDTMEEENGISFNTRTAVEEMRFDIDPIDEDNDDCPDESAQTEDVGNYDAADSFDTHEVICNTETKNSDYDAYYDNCISTSTDVPTFRSNDQSPNIFDDLNDKEFCEAFGCDITVVRRKRQDEEEESQSKRDTEGELMCEEIEQTPASCIALGLDCDECNYSIEQTCPTYHVMRSELSRKIAIANYYKEKYNRVRRQFEEEIKWYQAIRTDESNTPSVFVQSARFDSANEMVNLSIRLGTAQQAQRLLVNSVIPDMDADQFTRNIAYQIVQHIQNNETDSNL